MKYKTIFLTVFLSVLLYVSLALFGKLPAREEAPSAAPQDQAETTQRDPGDVPPPETDEQPGDDLNYDDDNYAEEMDTFSRLMFERELPKLTEKEKVIWSFRLAPRHTFL